ncbi:putative Chloride channel protein [Blattamonas nauphoetae]|uniref:Chloride channel protein n=1 Tax=Blattamonas nauphoetae TaxID=2049346 RepID=A0ABQ9YB12_9EUKA|nr:putative Chloride channel protein [Blattamonas nauphoetae]
MPRKPRDKKSDSHLGFGATLLDIPLLSSLSLYEYSKQTLSRKYVNKMKSLGDAQLTRYHHLASLKAKEVKSYEAFHQISNDTPADEDPAFVNALHKPAKKSRFAKTYLLFQNHPHLQMVPLVLIIALGVAAVSFLQDGVANFFGGKLRWYIFDSISHPVLKCVVYTLWMVAWGLLGTLFTVFFAPVTGNGAGVEDMIAIMSGVPYPEFLTINTILGKLLGNLCALMSGMFVERGGPTMAIAMILTHLVITHVPFFRNYASTPSLRSDIYSFAIAMGMACMNYAPVGGMLFSIELMSDVFLTRNYFTLFYASALSSFIARQLLSLNYSIFHLPDIATPPPIQVYEFLILIVLGAVIGFISQMFVRLLLLATRFFMYLQRPQKYKEYKRKKQARKALAKQIEMQQYPPKKRNGDTAKVPHDRQSLSTIAIPNQISTRFSGASGGMLHPDQSKDKKSSQSDKVPLSKTIKQMFFNIPQRWRRFIIMFAIPFINAIVSLPIPTLKPFAAGINPTLLAMLGDPHTLQPIYNFGGNDAYFIPMLALLFVVYFFVLSTNIRAPIPTSGLLSQLTLGAILGRIVGESLYLISPQYFPSPAIYAASGAAAFLSGGTHSISSVLILLELTGMANIAPGLTFCAAASLSVSRLLGENLYTGLMLVRKIPVLSKPIPATVANAEFVTVGDLMKQTTSVCLTVTPTVHEINVALKKAKFYQISYIPLIRSETEPVLLGAVIVDSLNEIMKTMLMKEKAIVESIDTRPLCLLHMQSRVLDRFKEGQRLAKEDAEKQKERRKKRRRRLRRQQKRKNTACRGCCSGSESDDSSSDDSSSDTVDYVERTIDHLAKAFVNIDGMGDDEERKMKEDEYREVVREIFEKARQEKLEKELQDDDTDTEKIERNGSRMDEELVRELNQLTVTGTIHLDGKVELRGMLGSTEYVITRPSNNRNQLPEFIPTHEELPKEVGEMEVEEAGKGKKNVTITRNMNRKHEQQILKRKSHRQKPNQNTGTTPTRPKRSGLTWTEVQTPRTRPETAADWDLHPRPQSHIPTQTFHKTTPLSSSSDNLELYRPPSTDPSSARTENDNQVKTMVIPPPLSIQSITSAHPSGSIQGSPLRRTGFNPGNALFLHNDFVEILSRGLPPPLLFTEASMRQPGSKGGRHNTTPPPPPADKSTAAQITHLVKHHFISTINNTFSKSIRKERAQLIALLSGLSANELQPFKTDEDTNNAHPFIVGSSPMSELVRLATPAGGTHGDDSNTMCLLPRESPESSPDNSKEESDVPQSDSTPSFRPSLLPTSMVDHPFPTAHAPNSTTSIGLGELSAFIKLQNPNRSKQNPLPPKPPVTQPHPKTPSPSPPTQHSQQPLRAKRRMYGTSHTSPVPPVGRDSGPPTKHQMVLGQYGHPTDSAVDTMVFESAKSPAPTTHKPQRSKLNPRSLELPSPDDPLQPPAIVPVLNSSTRKETTDQTEPTQRRERFDDSKLAIINMSPDFVLIDTAPFNLSIDTPLSKAHTLLHILHIPFSIVTEEGKYAGLLFRDDILELYNKDYTIRQTMKDLKLHKR